MAKIQDVLTALELKKTGKYENQFYIIDLEDSNEYARLYTLLDNKAINTEYPSFGKNTNDTTIKITNYFELDLDNRTYLLFLIANFETNSYYLKIGEKE